MSALKQPASLQKAGKLTVREFLWQLIRQQKNVQIADLIANMTQEEIKLYAIEPSKLRYYFEPWVKSGHLSATMQKDKTAGVRALKTYTLVKDTGVHPPRIDQNGNEMPITANELMWRTMRMLDSFSYQELASIAEQGQQEIDITSAKSYVETLHKAGYLVRIKASSNAGGLAKYRMKPAAWTGFKPPMIKRTKVVYDQNRHQIVWPKDEDIKSDY